MQSAIPIEAAPPDVRPAPAVRRDPWILNAWLDLTLVCGGLVFVLAALNAYVQRNALSPRTMLGLTLLGVLVTYVFSNAHTMATLVRIYWHEEDRRRFHFYTSVLVWPCLALCAVGLFVDGAAAILIKVYVIWVIQHYSSQCYGITLIYCYKRDYPLSSRHKKLLQALYLSGAAVAILRQFTWPDWGSRNFLSIQVPFWGPLPEPILQAVTAVFILIGVANLVLVAKTALDTKRLLPLPAVMLIGSTLTFLLLSGPVAGYLWLYVPAVFHGSQYLAVAASYHFKETAGGTEPTHAAMWKMLRSTAGGFYLVLLVLGGVFIYVGLPRILEETGTVNYTTALASIFAVINFHHFMTDRAIWKLRDPRIREILLA